ncbi:unnamed protein product [Didymodactylos carnosus]|uniref:Reverse transcriptase domain-containing protein n=1 Tax=Didymodactylos carnosus TaxID=1234261 RepID=A0A814RJ01_9BILA|nr:unnamed protein product [Didymodactylos carnosus]CAF3897649.1 unnamed protein product [Didymodactylos carnosus]
MLTRSKGDFKNLSIECLQLPLSLGSTRSKPSSKQDSRQQSGIFTKQFSTPLSPISADLRNEERKTSMEQQFESEYQDQLQQLVQAIATAKEIEGELLDVGNTVENTIYKYSEELSLTSTTAFINQQSQQPAAIAAIKTESFGRYNLDQSDKNFQQMILKNLNKFSGYNEDPNSWLISVISVFEQFKRYPQSIINFRLSKRQQQENESSIIGTDYIKRYGLKADAVAETEVSHVINTKPHSPPCSKCYPMSKQKEDALYDILMELMSASLISKAKSPYAAPALLTPKSDGTWRFVVDYKKLNNVTIKDSFPLPNMEQTLQRLGEGYHFFTKLDLKSGFWQIPIKSEGRFKTAFITPFGLYQFNVLPQGLTNSPPTFPRVMSTVLQSCRQFCQVYLDDIIIFSRTVEEHLDHLQKVLECLNRNNL